MRRAGQYPMRLIAKARKLVRLLSTRQYRHPLLRHGVAAAVEHENLLRKLNCATIIDIGANRGQFSLAAQQCCPNARVISFEPLPTAGDKFFQAAANRRCVLYGAAIGPRRMIATIHISGREDCSSLLPITGMVEIAKGTQEVSVAEVIVARLDEFICRKDLRAPALLKIDVQGYELQVLQGCSALLSSFDYVYVECSFVELYAGQSSPGDVIAFLRARGFGFAGVFNLSYHPRGRAVEGDFFFSRDPRLITQQARVIAETAELPPTDVGSPHG